MTTCNGKDFIEIKNILYVKRKGFMKIVVPFSLRNKIVRISSYKTWILGNPDGAKCTNTFIILAQNYRRY